jgi:hypothetical protein
MILTRKHLSRRTLLRGLGVGMALPLLDAMIPARATAETVRPKRLSVFYTPNGMIMQNFVPETAGADYATPSILEPLAAFREDISIVSGLAHYQASALGDGPGGHGRACPAFLTASHAKRTEGFDIRAGVSMDQVVAGAIGQETQFSSLELGVEPASLVGSCDIGYSCTYTNGLSWRSPSVALPVMANPRDVFERLFGDGDTVNEAARIAQLERRSSLLDFVMEDAARLSGELGANDRNKMNEYLEATRDVERRIQRAMESTESIDLGELERPAGIPESFEEHVRIMIDLQVIALQSDMTRVVTFMTGRELSNRAYPEIGIPDAHHMLSHHGHDAEKIAKLSRINAHHMAQLAYLLGRLKETPDGDGSLLDAMLVLQGCAFGDPNDHDHMDLPIMVAGGLARGGRHLATPKDTPMANLMVSMMQLLDVPVEQFGDSTGALSELAA